MIAALISGLGGFTFLVFRRQHRRREQALLRRLEAEKHSAGGIVIPDKAKEKPQEAEVLDIGPGAKTKTGETIPIPLKQGDRVRIKEGTFENFEGDVEEIDEANGRVTVMINIFGRSTPVELEHWQIDAV